MATGNKGRPAGKLGMAKASSRRAYSKTSQTMRHPEKGEGLGRRRTGAGAKAAPAKRSGRGMTPSASRRGLTPRGSTGIRPAGRGGPRQQAGGPRHQGLDAGEDRNP